MQTIKAIAKTKDLRRKCLLVLLILIICRVLAGVPTPGVNRDYFGALIESNASLGLLDAINGGGLSSMSVMALGITPYITASIVLQLLGAVFPGLHEIQKSRDKSDRDRVRKMTFWLGGALAAAEGVSMAAVFGRRGLLTGYTWYMVLLTAAVWVAGALFLIAMGELITAKLIGNGISLILAMNILASFPSDMMTMWEAAVRGEAAARILKGAALIAFLAALIAFIVVLNQTSRDIPVTHSGKTANSPRYAAPAKSSIPIKLCPGSVVPIVFASSLLSLPVLAAQFMGKDGGNWFLSMLNSSNWFSAARPSYSVGLALYVALIFAFSLFYTDILMNPREIADNLKKSGAAVPGIRPGAPTEAYLRKIMRQTDMIGACFLSVIAVIPYAVSGIFGISGLSILGTSLIIVVGVCVDTRDLLESLARGTVYKDSVRKGGIFNV